LRKGGANAGQSPRTFVIHLVPKSLVMSPLRNIKEFFSVISKSEDAFQHHGTTRCGENLQRAVATGPHIISSFLTS
jgi:hypothetical protein